MCPLLNAVEIAAFAVEVEVLRWMFLNLAPDQRNEVCVRIAHERLQQNVYAMIRMPPMQFGSVFVGIDLAPIVVEIYIFSDPIQAMDLVEGVCLDCIRIIAGTISWRDFDGHARIFAHTDQICCGYPRHFMVDHRFPRCIYFWRRGMAQDFVVHIDY